MSEEIPQAMRKKLEALFGEVKETVNKLRFLDAKNEINAHCENLISQVAFTVKSARENLDKIEISLTDEINQYRDKMLQEEPKSRDDLNLDLDKLSNELESFTLDLTLEHETLSTLDEFNKKAKNLKKQLRRLFFNNYFLQLQVNPAIKTGRMIGQLAFCYTDPEDTKIRQFRMANMDDESAEDFCELRTQGQISRDLSAMIFLQDGNLAVSVDQFHVYVLSSESKEVLFQIELKNRRGNIISMTQLPNGQLATGDNEGFVDIWDLDARQHVRTLRQQRHPIGLLKAMPNGNVACFVGPRPWHYPRESSPRGNWAICILKTTDAAEPPVRSIPCFYALLDLEVLSNDLIAYKYFHRLEDDYRQKENLPKRRGFDIMSCVLYDLVANKQRTDLQVPSDKFFDQKILPSGEVATVLEDGSLEMLNLEHGFWKEFKTPIEDYSIVCCMRQLIDGSLLIVHHSEDYKYGYLCTHLSCISPDGKYYAVGYLYGLVKIAKVDA